MLCMLLNMRHVESITLLKLDNISVEEDINIKEVGKCCVHC